MGGTLALLAELGSLRLAINGRRVLCVGRKSEGHELILGHSIPAFEDAASNTRAICFRHSSIGGRLSSAKKVWRLPASRSSLSVQGARLAHLR